MSTLAAIRAAQWVPVVGTIIFLKAIAPELIFILSGSAKHFFLYFHLAIHEIITIIWSDYNLLFLTILLLRYFRLAVNLFAYLFVYQADEIPEHPTITSDMAHVIIPTAEPTNSDFFRCVLSVLEKRPGWISIVTAHPDQTVQAREVLANLPQQDHTVINVTTGPMANKRQQVAHVLRSLASNREQNKDVLVVLVDDHVWWPSAKFLSAVLAPFEDPNVGIVAMHKRPERARGNGFADSLLNFVACLYLERHNFEICSSNAIDGSAFVVSGRTCVMRACIAMEDDFLAGYLDEHFFFGKFGPLNPDDDNYITRYIVRNNWDIKWQHSPEALMETSLGITGGYKKFWGQIQRWARSQWRSNPCTVFTDGSVWRRGQFWAGFGHLMSFINFAIVWDSMIVYLWGRSSYADFKSYHVALLILGSKFVKQAPFFYNNPQDLWLFPFSVLFGYFHSFVKLWALITFYDHSWSGRNLAAIQDQAGENDDDNENGGNGDGDDGNGHDADDDDSSDDGLDYGNDNGPGKRISKAPKPLSMRRTRNTSSSRNLPSGSNDHSRPGLNGPTSTSGKAVNSTLFTPWGDVQASQRYQFPANVREGQYRSSSSSSSGINTQYYGTPRTTLRSSSRLGDSSSSSDVVVNTTGYATNDYSRGRSLSREHTNLFVPASPQTPEREGSYHSGIFVGGAGDSSSSTQFIRQLATPPRTQYHPRVPDAPRKTSIAFIGDNPFPYEDEDISARRLEMLRGPIGKVPKYVYSRDFPRGDDCQRTHPDASYLSVRRGSSTKRCRSPQPNRYPVVSGRPRI